MSDTWYRDPVQLPPYEDCNGKVWTFDGVCLNPDPHWMLIDGWPDIVVDPPAPMEPITWADVEAMIRRFMPPSGVTYGAHYGCPVEGHRGCDLYNCRWDPEYTRR